VVAALLTSPIGSTGASGSHSVLSEPFASSVHPSPFPGVLPPPPLAGLPSVAETYVALNGTLQSGNFGPYNLPDVWGLAFDAQRGLLYAPATRPDLVGGGVAVINLSLDRVVDVVPLPANPGPTATLFDPLNQELYVADAGLGEVTVIDTLNDRVVANLTAGNNGGSTDAFAVDTLTGNVLLAGGDNVLTVINGTANVIVQNITFGVDLDNIAYDNWTNQLLVGDTSSGNLSVFNATSFQWVGSLSYPQVPSGIAVAPGGRTFYLASYTVGGSGLLGNLSTVNASSDIISRTIGFPGQPDGLALDPSNNTLYIATDSANLVAVNLTTDSLVPSPPPGSGAYWVAYDAVAATLAVGSLLNVTLLTGPGFYTASYAQTGVELSTIAVNPLLNTAFLSTGITSGYQLNLTTFDRTGGFYQFPATDPYPFAAPFAYSPGDARIFLASSAGLVVVNATSGHLVTNLGAGRCAPDGATYDAENDSVYVDGFCQPYGYVTVLNATSDLTIAVVNTSGAANVVGWDGATGDLWLQNNTAAGYSGNVSVINATTNAVTAYLPMSAAGPATFILYDPAANAMIVGQGCLGCSSTSSLTVYNASTGATLASYGTGSADPSDASYLSGVDEIAVADFGADNVSFYNASTFALVGNVSVGAGPVSLAYDPGSGDLYASNEYSGTVSVLPTNTTGAPYIESFSVTPREANAGSSVTFAVVAQGGSGSLSYAYSGLPTGCTTSNTTAFSCSPTGPGAFRVQVTVTDALGRSSSAYTDLRVGGLVLVSFGADPSSVYVGSPTTLTTVATGGYGWQRYAYTGLPAGCTTRNVSSLNCTPTASGTFTIEVTVTDARHHAVFANTTLDVASGSSPTIFSLTAVPSSISLGYQTTITTAATGGSGSAWLAHAYTNLPPGCASQNESTLTCAPIATGSYNVTVVVTNSFENSAVANTTLLVTKAPPPMIASFVANPATIPFGSQTVFETSATAGAGTLEYSYSGLPSPCTSQNASAIPCTPAANGTYLVSVTVTNSWGLTAVANTSLTVLPPVPPQIDSFTVAPTPIYLNQSTTFTVVAAGSGLSYGYAGLPAGCNPGNLSVLQCTPRTAGNYSVTATVTNRLGLSTSAEVALEVIAPAALRIASFVASPASVTIGGSTQISVTVSGAVGSPTYQYSGLPAGCPVANASELTCEPAATGTFTVNINVTDRLGRTTHAELTLTVAVSPPPPGPSSGSGPSSDLGLLLGIGVAVALLALVAAVLLLRRRRGPGNPKDAEPSDAAGAPGGSSADGSSPGSADAEAQHTYGQGDADPRPGP
jgi:DNA-binding beta-propeller fold protein YncE